MAQSDDKPKDLFAVGDLYEPYVGRWSKVVSREFVAWLSLPEHMQWLDVGCGTGALTSTVMESASPASVTGIDPSEGFLSYARNRVQDPRARFMVGDAQDIQLDSDTFDAAVSGLVLNFIPDQPRAAGEMVRVTKAGGTVAVYVWDYSGKMEFMRYFWDAAVELEPSARVKAEAHRFPICHPEALTALWERVGLTQVEVRAIDAPTHFRDFDDYWSPFLGGQGPAPGYAMSLTEEKRNELRDYVRTKLPTEADGSIRLIARAWAVRGVRV
jgi:SAM-dependent methyltransferase